jgi:hypothetical protein
MPCKTVRADGREFHQTTVRIPLALHDAAIEQRISMSATLTKALEKECGGVESFPGGLSPSAPSSTARRSKGQ